MMKRLILIAVLVAMLPHFAGATTSLDEGKVWTAEKLYAADLNTKFTLHRTYINTHLSWVTDITANAVKINQLYANRFTQTSNFVAAVTDSANHTMNAGFVYQNNGRAIVDSARIDTLYSPTTGTQLGAAFYMIPLTDNTGYIGTPTKRLRSTTQDTARITLLTSPSAGATGVTVLGTVTVTGRALLDTLDGASKTTSSFSLTPLTASTGRIGTYPLPLQSVAADTLWAVKQATAAAATVTGTLTVSGAAVVGLDSSNSTGKWNATNFPGVLTLATRLQNTGQPLFIATLSAESTNSTGDGTTLSTTIFDTEIVDQASNFAAGVFTAPVTGYYVLGCQMSVGGVATGEASGVYIGVAGTSTNRIIISNETFGGAPGCVSGFGIVKMTKGDTASMSTTFAGGAKDVDIQQGTTTTTIFYGALL